MLEENVARVVGRLGDEDKVLDVGGWYRPFRRATHVIDMFPFDTRGEGGFQGPADERFSRDTWVQHDICSRKPWPFPDQAFDFVTCSHVLEDIRDPIWVCQEMMRVAKAGYIEVPSVEAELSRGIETRRWAGYQHHHWIVDIEGGQLNFLLKPHFLMGQWKFHLPAWYGASLSATDRVQWLFWEEEFETRESMIIYDSALRWVEERVRSTKAWSPSRYKLDSALTRIKSARRGTR